MSKKEHSNNNGAHLGEISTIRDILMGQQINEFEERFNELQKQIADMESRLEQKVKELYSTSSAQNKELLKVTSNQLADLENNTQNRMTQIEKSLQDGLADLQQMVEDSSLNDKERIGRLLLEAGNSLLKS